MLTRAFDIAILQIFISRYKGSQKFFKKYRNMNLTIDKKRHKWYGMHDTFIDRCTNWRYILSMIFFVLCCKSTFNRWKWNRSWHKWTVRPSVCLSRSHIARRQTFFRVWYSNHSGFPRTKTYLRTSDAVTSYGGAEYRWGVYFLAISDQHLARGKGQKTEP